MWEEIGVNVPAPADDCHFRLSTNDFDMRAWVITDWTGDPTNASPDEHDEIAWFSEPQAKSLGLAHSSYLSLISEVFRRQEPRR